jgi:predicted dehydrogenase
VAATRLRAALIGAGRRGTQQAATLAELPELFEFVAVCDPNAVAVQKAAERYGLHGYANVPELFASEKLDLVVIATPPDLHHVGVKAAADHGVNALVETSLGSTRAMMDVTAEAAERGGIVVEVGENYGRRPSEMLNRAAVAAGLVGQLVHLSVFNGAANQESAYHIISLLRAYAGGADVTEVQAIGRTNRIEGIAAGAETWMDASLTFDSGVVATCNYVTSWNAPHRWGRPRTVSIEGTTGYIVSEEAGARNRLHRVEGGEQRDYVMEVEPLTGGGRVAGRFSYSAHELEVTNPFPSLRTDVDPNTVCDGIGRATELRSLHRAITENGAVEYGVTAGRRSQEVGLAIMEAARVGHPISSHLGEQTPWERAEHERFRKRYGVDPIADVDKLIRVDG